jgi:hypothetical protein
MTIALESSLLVGIHWEKCQSQEVCPRITEYELKN